MVRILVLVMISFCFTALSIYANCDLPTGGACSIEDLKREQVNMQENLSKHTLLDKVDSDYFQAKEDTQQKDLPKQVDLKKLNDIEVTK